VSAGRGLPQIANRQSEHMRVFRSGGSGAIKSWMDFSARTVPDLRECSENAITRLSQLSHPNDLRVVLLGEARRRASLDGTVEQFGRNIYQLCESPNPNRAKFKRYGFGW